MKPDIEKKQSFSKKSLNRLSQLLSFLQQNWIQSFDQFQYRISSPRWRTSQNQQVTLKLNQKIEREKKNTIHLQKSKYHQKLKQVNSLLEEIQINLTEVTQGIQKIYLKLQQYKDVQTMRSRKRYDYYSIKMMIDNYDKNHYDNQVFQNCFQQVYKAFFRQSLTQIMNKSAKKITIWLLSVQTKLTVLPPLIDSAYMFKTDITCCQPYSPKYSYAWENIEVKQFDQNINQNIQNQISYLKKIMKMTTSAVVTEIRTIQVDIFQKIVFGLSFPIFLFADQESQLRCYQLWRKPSVQKINLVWNMPEKGAMKQCKKITFPSIRTNFFIYLPTIVHRDSTHSLITNQQIKPEIFLKPNQSQYVRVLVLYSNKLRFNEKQKQHQPFSLFTCWDIHEQIDLDTIVIHMHGGGFVALSSQSSQSYTRLWANKLKVPIFSIDYRKPPNFRFPVGLEDCYACYTFIIEKIHQYFNVRPRNVVLAGDSAGGNLAVALQGLLMQRKYPILPKGIFLAYPAVDLRMKYTPSRMLSFEDPILIPPLLLLCMKQYLGEHSQSEENPFASPLLLTEYFIQTGRLVSNDTKNQQKNWPQNWPSTRIAVGNKDPLYDDSLRLLERMAESGIDVKLKIYNQLSHAFLSMDFLVTACGVAIQDSINQLRFLINK